MLSYEIIDKERNIAMLSFSSMQMPVFTVNPRSGWVNYGKRNDFPNQLLRLFEEHEEHGAIVNAKANYLFGKSIKAKDSNLQPIVDDFFKQANRFDSWDNVNDKVKVDCELFNCVYFQVITDLAGNPKEFYHLQNSSCRLSEDKRFLGYSDNWLDRREPISEYSRFEPGSRKPGVFFMLLEYYKPSKNKLDRVYATPQYISCVKSISTDVDISTFNNNYVANGFSAGTLITFFSEEPKNEGDKRKIKDMFLNTYSSPEKAGSIVLAWAGQQGQAPLIQALSIDDLDKKFEFTSKRCLDKILRGHNVTNPELFGVKTEGQLGTRVSLKESYELMLNTYTKPRQKKLLEFYSNLIFITKGLKVELEIDQLEPIGLDLANDPDLTVDERRELKGFKPLTPQALDAQGNPVAQVTASAANDSLTGLSAADNADMRRIVRDFQKGRMGDHMALDRLQAYGLTEESAKKWLGMDEMPVKMASQVVEFVVAQFSAIDTTDEIELELLSEEDVHIHNAADAMRYELSMQLKFKETDSSKGLLGTIKKLLGVNPKPVEKQEDTYKTEIITKYKYALKPDAPALVKGGTSRPFCEKMMALNKEFTFEQIDSVRVAGLSNGFPELDNIWDFRGGYYTNPKTGQTDPFCRHYWKAITYKVKTKV